MFPQGLRARAALLFLSSTLALGGFAAVVTYRAAEDGLRAAASAEVAAVADEKAAAVAGLFADVLHEVTLIAESGRLVATAQALQGPSGRAAARTELARWVRSDSPFTSAFLMDVSSSEVLVATDEWEEGQLRDAQAYFREGLRGPYVQNPYYSVALRGPAMTASAPVRAGGEVVAVVGTRVALGRVQEILSRGIHPSSDAYLVDRAGLFVTQPRQTSESAPFRLTARTPDVEACLGGRGALAFTTDHRGAVVLASFRPLQDQQLCLVTTVAEADALAGVDALRSQIVAVLVIASLAFTGIGLVLADAVTRPVIALRRAVARAAEGDRSEPVAIGGTDEIGQLAREFDRMRTVIVANERDLADRAARLAEANAELESFSYSVAHDLRAPLRSIDGFARALMEDHATSLDPEGARYLDRISAGALRMAALIDDLLRLSRVSRAELHPLPVDVSRVAREVTDELRHREPDRRVEVTIAPDVSAVADPALVRVAIANLLENAWKFTRPRDEARIELAGERRDDTTWIVVRDNGVGFDPAYREQLFGAFQRLHSTADFPGTGIGLATVRRIAVRHGGSVWADGAVDRGAQFGISFGNAA